MSDPNSNDPGIDSQGGLNPDVGDPDFDAAQGAAPGGTPGPASDSVVPPDGNPPDGSPAGAPDEPVEPPTPGQDPTDPDDGPHPDDPLTSPVKPI
ncbi:hypothetical protein [Schumannella soli]|uniref:Uncharacterized protein n=1 Tax=Schumannella soli TaxID=2590779 RepID=A0A506Y8H0_9MICO|nr:hypothetical protein [Schumannella soli]TPW77487.1 hypothetical protein FJ657_02050 [Schumannella soli]